MMRAAQVSFLLTAAALVLWASSGRSTNEGSRAHSRPEQGLAIVVNRSNPVDNLTSIELRKIFLGVRSHWPNGRRIAVIMLEPGYRERETILRDVYHMSEDRYRDHFLKGLFTGDVFVSPKELSGPAVVRKFVFNAPGAIGYLRDSDADESVKVVRIDGLLPTDGDYRLQIDVAATD